ncbi:hypothetical protein [Micromonospora sp. HUAS LYJ1]|uniref:hypothetical protein n=1 Tax=Micromonospora sp. HUAS LYJ1 TaxID=3061626 RepID=UPI002673491D|nr:hypothetical protein [Micromonospora sp. HUAS LYJ1]WKU05355.1 hypothetical protein Q2K16_32240 [Micromonospora sp. HUAS LYJ1]
MTIPELPRAMEKVAEYAAAPPADLLERVVAGRRRQRRRRVTLTAAAAATVVAAGSLVALERLSPEPPAPPATVTRFRLPAMPQSPPVLSDTWPAAIITADLPKVPNDAAPVVIGRIGSKLLVGSERPTTGANAVTLVQEGRIWTFDPGPRRYQTAIELAEGATDFRASVVGGAIAVISSKSLGGKRTTRIDFRHYIGDHKTASADIAGTGAITGTYADDRYGYWDVESPPGQARIFRVPFGGTSNDSAPIEGFDGLRIDGSGWARNAESTEFRNLTTGERRRAVPPAGSDNFRCVPAFCLGHDTRGWFVQRLDGSERADLPYPGVPALIGGLTAASGPGRPPVDSGMLLLADGVLLDPISGRYGAVTRGPHCDLRASQADGGLVLTWRMQDSGACADPRTTAYLAATD